MALNAGSPCPELWSLICSRGLGSCAKGWVDVPILHKMYSVSKRKNRCIASPSGDAESRMDDEVGDNDEEMNAVLDDLDALGSWADSFCADVISSDFVKEASPCGLICESSEIASATTSGKAADLRIREEQRQ